MARMKKGFGETFSKTVDSEGSQQDIRSSYDIVGDIAIIRLTKKSIRHRDIIAQTIMNEHKNIETVLTQTGAVCGDFRLRKLEYVAGESRTITVHKEYGCSFRVDVENCYFSPRLHHERMRIVEQVRNGEVVVNMFAGVGCFSILIAKRSQVDKVYSIDINPTAVRYLRENIRVNDVYGKVVPMLGDSKKVIEENLLHVADRVLMPLPEKALEYLPYAILALKEVGGWIHYYDFEHARKNESAIEKVRMKVSQQLEGLQVAFDLPFSRVVRPTGPNWYQIVLDIHLRKLKPWEQQPMEGRSPD
jgi:tRNA (guanine37-N1)-methyltransferase